MTSSRWLKSALCSSDSTGTVFRYLEQSQITVRQRLCLSLKLSVLAQTKLSVMSAAVPQGYIKNALRQEINLYGISTHTQPC